MGTIGLRMGGTELAAAERAGRSLVEGAPFRELRVLLREVLGVAPGQAAQELHRRLLAQVDAGRPAS